jgi:glycosyltransferase involved in cell wall biosynthesis
MFPRHVRSRTDGKFIVLFPGSLQWHQGLDIAIEAFARVKTKVPNAEFHVYSGAGGNQEIDLRQLVKRLDLDDSVKFLGGISIDQMGQVIANADLGVVPKRADSFGNEAYSTKIMEFMSQGVPVVVSRTKVDTFYFEEGVVHFFRSGDSEAMAEAMLDVINDKNLRQSLISHGYEYVEHHGWGRKKKEYLDLIDSLSTELFVDVQPALGSASVVELDSERKSSADPFGKEADGSDVAINEPSSLSSLKGR